MKLCQLFCWCGIAVSTKREQTLELNACARTVTPNEVDENQDTFAVSSNYWWQFFLVARLIKDKADASSTVNQSVMWELFVWSWNSIQNINRQFFRAKYLKREIEFEEHYILCMWCVFAAFPSLWRPFGVIFCLTVDATARQSKATSTWQDFPSTVKQNNIAQNISGLQQFGKGVKTQQTHNR